MRTLRAPRRLTGVCSGQPGGVPLPKSRPRPHVSWEDGAAAQFLERLPLKPRSLGGLSQKLCNGGCVGGLRCACSADPTAFRRGAHRRGSGIAGALGVPSGYTAVEAPLPPTAASLRVAPRSCGPILAAVEPPRPHLDHRCPARPAGAVSGAAGAPGLWLAGRGRPLTSGWRLTVACGSRGSCLARRRGRRYLRSLARRRASTAAAAQPPIR